MRNKIEIYVRKNYKQTFGDKPLIIEELGKCYLISAGRDDSPLILSKNITNE